MLGRHLIKKLLLTNEFNLFCQSRIKTDGLVFCDPTVIESINNLLDEVNPDVIINLIALTDVDFCEFNINHAYTVNNKIVENIAFWILSKKSKAFLVQISTDQLYSGNGFSSESDIFIPNVYAYSKYAGELAAKNVSNHLVVRTNFFGKSITPGRYSFSDWIVNSLKENITINLADDILFTPLSIGYLCEILIQAIKNNINGTFNFGSGSGISKYEFGLKLSKLLHLNPNLIIKAKAFDIGFKVARPLDMRMDVGGIESHLGKMPDINYLLEQQSIDYLKT